MTPVIKISHRPDLQGVRAISIILVVLNHAGCPSFSGGFVGVDVFFVLSGYFITRLLVQEYIESGGIRLLNFFARRLKRLLPALLVMLSGVVLIGSLLLSDYQLTQQTASVNYAATWISNLYFSLTIIDYFSEMKSKDLFLHTWSLGVEEQFYLIWPFLILLSLTLIKKLQISMSWRFQFIAFIIFMFLFGLAVSKYWTINNPLFAFYMMPSRIWQFALGALAFIWFHKYKDDFIYLPQLSFSFFRKECFAIVGIILIFGSAVLFDSNMAYPGVWALLPSIGALLLISAGYLNKNNITTQTLSHRSLVWVGDRSYSWYLWHWPVLMLGFSLGVQPLFNKVIGLVVISFLMAIISYQYIELPFWKGRFSNIKSNYIILSSILSMLILIWGIQNFLKPAYNRSIAQASSIGHSSRGDMPIIYRKGCDSWTGNADVQPCMFGDVNATKTVALIGDSIGAQWFSLLPEILKSPEWRTIVLTKSACPMVDEDFFYDRIGKVYTVCTNWRNAAIDYLASIRPDIIFVGSSAVYDFSEKKWVDGSKRVLARLSKASKDVIVLPGTYKLSFDGPSCLERNLSSILTNNDAKPQVCEEQALTTQVDVVTRYLIQAMRGLPNVKLLDINDLVCPNGRCRAINPDGVVVFRDGGHLTDSFVRKQEPAVRERLRILGLESFPGP